MAGAFGCNTLAGIDSLELLIVPDDGAPMKHDTSQDVSKPDASPHGDDGTTTDVNPGEPLVPNDGGSDVIILPTGDGSSTVCASGQCRCQADGGCTDNMICTDHVCVDPSSDPKYCGPTLEACTGGRMCVAGACTCGPQDPGGFCRKDRTCVDFFLDDKNCGTCGHDCLNGHCLGGTCFPIQIAIGQDEPASITLHNNVLYFTNAGSSAIGNSLGHVAADATGPCTRAGCVYTAREINNPYGVAADDHNVYVANYANGNTGDLLQIPNTLGPTDKPRVLVTRGGLWQVAVANNQVYWTARNDPRLVGAIPIGGGSEQDIALLTGGTVADARALAVDGMTVLWGLIRSTGTVYSQAPGGSCSGATCTALHGDGAVPLDYGVPQNFAIGVNAMTQEDWIFWTSADGPMKGRILAMNAKGGCSGVTPCPWVVAYNQNDPTFLVADNARQFIYWTNAGDGTIRHSAMWNTCNGPKCQALVPSQGVVSGLAQDDAALYATVRHDNMNNPQSGSVFRLAK
jgi:hypothetical protein